MLERKVACATAMKPIAGNEIYVLAPVTGFLDNEDIANSNHLSPFYMATIVLDDYNEYLKRWSSVFSFLFLLRKASSMIFHEVEGIRFLLSKAYQGNRTIPSFVFYIRFIRKGRCMLLPRYQSCFSRSQKLTRSLLINCWNYWAK